MCGSPPPPPPHCNISISWCCDIKQRLKQYPTPKMNINPILMMCYTEFRYWFRIIVCLFGAIACRFVRQNQLVGLKPVHSARHKEVDFNSTVLMWHPWFVYPGWTRLYNHVGEFLSACNHPSISTYTYVIKDTEMFWVFIDPNSLSTWSDTFICQIVWFTLEPQ